MQSDAVRDEERTEEIAKYAVLGDPPRRDLQALVSLAAQVCDVPTAVINLITASEQVQIAAVGIDPAVCSREDSMCAAILHDTEPVVVPDARSDPRFAANPFVTGEIAEVRFYAANHLITPDGVAIGTLCVFDVDPRAIDAQQQEALRMLADRVVDLLELGLRTRQLERSLAQLRETRDELRRSNEQLASFASQAAHDLRNPLTAVTMSLEMLREQSSTEADEEARWMVDRALSGAVRMDQMIEALLSYGRLGGELRHDAVDLDEVMADVRMDLTGELEGADLTVDPLPQVYGDRTQLRAVMQNLVANALKFTRPVAPPRVRVTGRDCGTGWRIEVVDNGPGVAPEHRERVFEPMVRGSAQAEGSGLGLAICARAVRAHGGSIGLDGGPGGGALVWFELPRPQAA